MKKYLLNSLLFIALQTNAQDLPGRHQLTKNDLGEYYVINHENIYGCQFHPELSDKYGFKILSDFIELI